MVLVVRALLVSILVAAVSTTSAEVSPSGVATFTDGARAQGVVTEDNFIFKGIPYAEPPTGNLRWAPTVDISMKAHNDRSGVDVFDATLPPARCMQEPTSRWAPAEDVGETSEDCLTMTVWVPRKAQRSKQGTKGTLVVIHGGDFVHGSSSLTAQDGSRLSHNEEICVVSVNYRLGLFASYAHKALSSESLRYPTSGNYGLEDQISALRWINREMGPSFGCDGAVTLYGWGSGGAAAMAHYTSSRSWGLFDRLIVQSAPFKNMGMFGTHLVMAEQKGCDLAREAGCEMEDDVETIKCMRDLSADKVMALRPWFGSSFKCDHTHANGMFYPIVDGVHLNGTIASLLQDRHTAKVSIMLGTAQVEPELETFLRFPMAISRNTLDVIFNTTFGSEVSKEIYKEYEKEKLPPRRLLNQVMNDKDFFCPAKAAASMISYNGETVVMLYRFEIRGPSPRIHATSKFCKSIQAGLEGAWIDFGNGTTVAHHLSELPYIFDYPNAGLEEKVDRPFIESVQDIWGSFVRKDFAEIQKLWRFFTDRNHMAMLRIANPRPLIEQVPDNFVRCKFWEKLERRIATGETEIPASLYDGVVVPELLHNEERWLNIIASWFLGVYFGDFMTIAYTLSAFFGISFLLIGVCCWPKSHAKTE